MRTFLLFTMAITALTACASSVAGGGSNSGSGSSGGSATAASTGSSSGNSNGSGGAPSGLYVEVTGSGEAPFTAPCRQQTVLLTGMPPAPILPGPADEIMIGELGGCVISACGQPGANGPRVALDLGAIFTDMGGTYPATVSLYDDKGNHWAAKGTVIVAPTGSCDFSALDGGVAGLVTGQYSATNLEPVVAMDAGPSPLGPIASLSGSFRVYMMCESGGS